MSDNAKVTLLFFANILLYFIIGELNNFSSNFSVYLHLDILVLIFFGLYIHSNFGVLFAAILGLLADAAHPVPTGTYLIGYLAIWLFFVWCQKRIRRQNPIHIRFVAIVGQLGWIFLLSLVAGHSQFGHGVYWQRMFVDILASSLVVYLFVWPWCQFQKKLLYSIGWDLEAQASKR